MKAEKEKCAICGEYHYLAKHVKIHGLTSEEYYRKYLMKPGEGVCKTCGAPTKFCGLTEKRFAPYCGNKCHNNDKEYLFIRSLNRKNKSPEEKAATRAKQIAAWEKTMGPDWAKKMAQHGFETYKERTGYDTPWANPEVRKKCEERWGASSPACLDEVKEKISDSTKKYFDDHKDEFYENKMKELQTICKDIVDFDKFSYYYKCPDCGTITKFGSRSFKTAQRLNNFKYLCSKCSGFCNGRSLIEHEFVDYIKSIYPNIKEHDRKTLSTVSRRRELDVYIPELKLAFEFDGTFWHADPRFYAPDHIIRISDKAAYAKDIWEGDKKKDEMCKELGITLIRIKEYDWENDNINTKHLISEAINNVKCKNE